MGEVTDRATGSQEGSSGALYPEVNTEREKWLLARLDDKKRVTATQPRKTAQIKKKP